MAKYMRVSLNVTYQHAQTPGRSEFDYVNIWPILSLSRNLKKFYKHHPRQTYLFYLYCRSRGNWTVWFGTAKIGSLLLFWSWSEKSMFQSSSFILLLKQEGHDGPGSLTWENLNQMLKTNFWSRSYNHNQHSDYILWRLKWNVAIYITKIWPSELPF